jgi:hypothetical protein
MYVYTSVVTTSEELIFAIQILTSVPYSAGRIKGGGIEEQRARVTGVGNNQQHGLSEAKVTATNIERCHHFSPMIHLSEKGFGWLGGLFVSGVVVAGSANTSTWLASEFGTIVVLTPDGKEDKKI